MQSHQFFRAFLLAAGLMAAGAAFAGAPAQPQPASSSVPFPVLFPVTLAHVERSESTGLSHDPGARFTWQASVPGLSFCVAYGGAHGVDVTPAMGHSYIGDRTHCLSTGRDGKATDFVAFQVADDQEPDPVLTATVVLVDDEVHTDAVEVKKLPPMKH
jgi:hypothetical protein